MAINENQVARKIKAIRLNRGETMKEFGMNFNPPASDSIVSRWERAVSIPSSERIKVIAELGDMSVDELIYGSKEEYVHQVIADYVAEKGDTINPMVEKLTLLHMVVHYPEVYNHDETIINKYSSIVYGNQGAVSSDAFFDLYEGGYAATIFINFLNDLHERTTNLVEYTKDEKIQNHIKDIQKEVSGLVSLNESLNQLLKEFDLDFKSKRRDNTKKEE